MKNSEEKKIIVIGLDKEFFLKEKLRERNISIEIIDIENMKFIKDVEIDNKSENNENNINNDLIKKIFIFDKNGILNNINLLEKRNKNFFYIIYNNEEDKDLFKNLSAINNIKFFLNDKNLIDNIKNNIEDDKNIIKISKIY